MLGQWAAALLSYRLLGLCLSPSLMMWEVWSNEAAQIEMLFCCKCKFNLNFKWKTKRNHQQKCKNLSCGWSTSVSASVTLSRNESMCCPSNTVITLGLLPVVGLHQRAMTIIITHTHLLCLLLIKSHVNNFNKQYNTHTCTHLFTKLTGKCWINEGCLNL